MKLESKRIFVDNLPQNVTQLDLESKFAEYGSVSAVEIKQRKNAGPRQSQQFSYVTLTISKDDLFNCLEEFANNKWKGQWVQVKEAKESFMDRLKRERAEQSQNENSVVEVCPAPQIEPLPPTLPYVNNSSVSTRVYHSSSSDDEDTPKQDFIVNGSRKQKNDISEYSNNCTSKKVPLLKQPTSKTKDTTSIAETNNVPLPVSISNQKRMQSMIEMRKNYQQQKLFVKHALSNIDSKPKNKIIFDEDYIIQTSPTKKTKKHIEATKTRENKISLFENDDDVDNVEYNFEIREQFEGLKGQKLMQLQSKFKNDKRFTMDERFLEDEYDEDETSAAKKAKMNDDEQSNHGNEMTFDEEREKQFEILEEVLGQKVRRKAVENDGKHDRQNHKMMLRFDPSQPTHSKFEIREENKKKHKDIQSQLIAKPAEEPKPEVSKETFYKIAVNLKDALQETSEFSLANLFNKTIQAAEPEKIDSNSATEKPKSSYQNEPNPFRYDSSGDEDDSPSKINEKSVEPVRVTKVGPAKLWTESFFFKNDDYRLQEGLDFIKRLEVDDQSDFHKLRRNLHEIVKAKVRNNQRKNRPFQRKLGGKKRLRVKRAMKR